MANPMQFTIVNAVPRYSAIVLLAIKVENCGLSATTTAPQNKINTIKTHRGANNKKGETRQQIPEALRENNATDLLVVFLLICPPRAQDTAPILRVKNASSGIFKFRAFSVL